MEQTIILRGDATELLKALFEIADAPLETLDSLADISQFVNEIASVEMGHMSTLSTREIVVRFNPSKRLIDLVATLRARERDFLLSKKV